MIEEKDLTEGYYWARQHGEGEFEPVKVVSCGPIGLGLLMFGDECGPWMMNTWQFHSRLDAPTPS